MPDLEDTTDHIQSAGLDNTAPDRFASPNTDVDDALKSERETIGSLFVERFWIQTGLIWVDGNLEGIVRR